MRDKSMHRRRHSKCKIRKERRMNKKNPKRKMFKRKKMNFKIRIKLMSWTTRPKKRHRNWKAMTKRHQMENRI